MATNIPPHNLREVAEGVQWLLAHPEAEDEELLNQLLLTVKGPDFPTRGLIMGTRGIEDAYRTGRGVITMRAMVTVEEIQNRTCLVVTELPYQVNPDNLKVKIAELVDSGRIAGIADLRDDTSGKTGLRIVIVLKRDAVAAFARVRAGQPNPRRQPLAGRRAQRQRTAHLAAEQADDGQAESRAFSASD